MNHTTQPLFRTKFEVGLVKLPYYTNRQRVSVTFTLNLQEGKHWETLAPVTGVTVSATYSSRSMSGRMANMLPQYLDKFHNLVERWHLNDLRAGTLLQTKALETLLGYDPYEQPEKYDPRVSYYTHSCALLDSVGLLTDPVLNYKYGSNWLFEPAPVEALEEFAKYVPGLSMWLLTKGYVLPPS